MGSLSPLEVSADQLAFPFAASARRAFSVVESAPPRGSRRILHAPSAGKRLRLDAAAAAKERPLDELRLEQSLLPYLPPGKRLQVTLTDNRYTMVAVRRAPTGYTLRIHRMFAGVEPRLLRAIARYVVHNDRRASELIGQFIDQHQHVIKQQIRSPRRVILRTAGRFHDLRAHFDQLNAAHFGGTLDARITWGPAVRSAGARRSIKMGSFAVEDRLIRIHPILDHESVPAFFVAWIVFHEMLHGKHEVERRGGRRCFHTESFQRDERAYPDYERATVWEKANIDRLLGP